MKSFSFQWHISVLRCLIMEPVQATVCRQSTFYTAYCTLPILANTATILNRGCQATLSKTGEKSQTQCLIGFPHTERCGVLLHTIFLK
jgi:hypothetical protein